MKKLYLTFSLLIYSLFIYAQFGGCGNKINSVTLTPIENTNNITLTINSSCCHVHSLENYSYTNNSQGHILNLCYRESGLTLFSTINNDIAVENINTTGVQNLTINPFYFNFLSPEVNCSSNIPFDVPTNISFEAPLTQPIVFTLNNTTFLANKLYLFPNPNSGIFSIKLPPNIEIAQLSIFDLSGKEIANINNYTTNNQLDFNNLSKGIYFVKVKSDEISQVLKFIIN